MRYSSISIRSRLLRSLTAATALLVSAGAAWAQSSPFAGSGALPWVPYWWTVDREREIEAIPLLWLNDVDGGLSVAGSDACCVLGLAVRHRTGPATLWWGVGFGIDADGGTPAALEGAVEFENGVVSFRRLHGRNGLDARYAVQAGRSGPDLALGISAVWIDDEAYFDPVPLFECPVSAPGAPCEQRLAPYPWSQGRDHAVAAHLDWGDGVWGSPRVTGTLLLGLEVLGGEHDYAGGELSAAVGGPLREARWRARLAGGWVSHAAPQQRRFLLHGAGPIERWLNPYLEARGALLADVPYFVPGGPNLRAYHETRPLVNAYLGLSGEISREARLPSGLWGRVGAFAEAAWLPGIPDRLGPEQLGPNGDLLFDWQELPEGEGEERGQFRARALELAPVWADAGLTLAGGYRRVGVVLSFPLWANEPGFADTSITGGETRSFTLRWALSIVISPRPGEAR